jgi:hypothetical protein
MSRFSARPTLLVPLKSHLVEIVQKLNDIEWNGRKPPKDGAARRARLLKLKREIEARITPLRREVKDHLRRRAKSV